MPKFLEGSTHKEIYKSAASVDKLQKRLGQEGKYSLAFLDKKHEVKVYDAAPKTPSGEVDKEGVLHQMGKFNLAPIPFPASQNIKFILRKREMAFANYLTPMNREG